MNKRHALYAAILMIATTSAATAAFATETPKPALQPAATAAPATTAITKEQAIEMALKAHPGKVIKADDETKKGKEAWEVKIKGDDGKKWEVYYEIATGELLAEEED